MNLEIKDVGHRWRFPVFVVVVIVIGFWSFILLYKGINKTESGLKKKKSDTWLMPLLEGQAIWLTSLCLWHLRKVGQGLALSYLIYEDNKRHQFGCSANKSSSGKHISKSHWSLALPIHNREFGETTNWWKHRVSIIKPLRTTPVNKVGLGTRKGGWHFLSICGVLGKKAG